MNKRYFKRSVGFGPQVLTCCALCCIAVPVSSLVAAERLIVSPSRERILLPDDLEHQQELERRFSGSMQKRQGGGASLDGLVSPPPSSSVPGGINSKKLQQFIDQRQNWIFSTPQSLDKQSSMNEAFGVRDSAEEAEEKSKGTVEKFMQGSNKRNSTQERNKRPSNDEDSSLDKKESDPFLSSSTSTNSLNSLKSFSKSTDSMSETIASAQNGSSSNQVASSTSDASQKEMSLLKDARTGSQTGLQSASNFKEVSFADILKGARGAKDDFLASQRSPSFQDILKPQKPGFLTGPGDPASTALDNTRNPLQPFSPLSGGLSFEPKNRTDGIGLGGPDRLNGIKGFDDLNTKVFGHSFSLPSAATQINPALQPKPTMLEIPRRNF